jgi:hypothetical protein
MAAPDTTGTPTRAEIVRTTQSDLEKLKSRIEAIEVKTPQDYVAICTLLVDARGFIKRWQKVFADTIDTAKLAYDTAKNSLKVQVVAAEAVVEIAEKKAEAYRVEEKRLAEAEQRRINEENQREQKRKAEEQKRADEKAAADKKRAAVAEIRELLQRGKIGKREAEKRLRAAGAEEEAAKCAAAAAADEAKAAPAPAVKVEANIPKVAGIKGRTNWRATSIDEHVLVAAFLKEPGRLRPYIQANEKTIGEFVRSVKDKAKAEAAIPGIVVESEESV